mmetsp:Transcript_2472/g.3627  ORF Transcript_2472/g.3627 Transcript_2472/m.3627 type:complete len:216 (+) Transcript_2472:953-1600(+)
MAGHSELDCDYAVSDSARSSRAVQNDLLGLCSVQQHRRFGRSAGGNWLEAGTRRCLPSSPSSRYTLCTLWSWRTACHHCRFYAWFRCAWVLFTGLERGFVERAHALLGTHYLGSRIRYRKNVCRVPRRVYKARVLGLFIRISRYRVWNFLPDQHDSVVLWEYCESELLHSPFPDGALVCDFNSSFIYRIIPWIPMGRVQVSDENQYCAQTNSGGS